MNGGSGGQSSLEQEGGQWRQKDEQAGRATWRHGGASDLVVVGCEGESVSAAETVAAAAHAASRAADVVTWGSEVRGIVADGVSRKYESDALLKEFKKGRGLLASWKSTSLPSIAFRSLLLMILSCMICCRMVMSGLVMSSSTSGLLI